VNIRFHGTVKDLFRLWFSTATDDEVCIELRIVRATMAKLARKYGLPARLHAKADGQRRPDDPTPQEIVERAAIERSRWSPEERERRIVGGSRRVEVADYAYDGRQCAFRY
jgi:hypothetical protein